MQPNNSAVSDGTQVGEETFETLLRQLQGIVEQMEGGELALEDSLSAFERGIALARRGQTILDAAERKVELLLKDGRTEAFSPQKGEQQGP